MAEDQLYLRYKKFHKLDLGVVEPQHWWAYFRDLLPLEANLVCGDAIGEVTEFPFYFEVVDDRRIR